MDAGVAEAGAEGRSPGPGTKGCPLPRCLEGWPDGGLGHPGRVAQSCRGASCMCAA